MSPAPSVGRSVCRVAGCSWRVELVEPRDRDRAWLAHWRAVHAYPATETTRCLVPACGWSSTSSDVAELRGRAIAHRATHEGNPTDDV